MSSFRYSPLISQSSFRLLRVFGSNAPESTVECEVFEVSLVGPPEYEAISYAWEGQIPSETILCGGTSLIVTQNSLSALQRFRPVQEESCRLLWIDAVCVDQSPEAVEERNSQVSMMNQIYSNATRVLIWLCQRKETRETDLVSFCFLSDLAMAELDLEGDALERHFVKLAEAVDAWGTPLFILIFRCHKSSSTISAISSSLSTQPDRLENNHGSSLRSVLIWNLLEASYVGDIRSSTCSMCRSLLGIFYVFFQCDSTITPTTR